MILVSRAERPSPVTPPLQVTYDNTPSLLSSLSPFLSPVRTRTRFLRPVLPRSQRENDATGEPQNVAVMSYCTRDTTGGITLGSLKGRRHWWKRAELTDEWAQTIHVILMLYCKICGTKNVYRLKCGSLYFTAHQRFVIFIYQDYWSHIHY